MSQVFKVTLHATFVCHNKEEALRAKDALIEVVDSVNEKTGIGGAAMISIDPDDGKAAPKAAPNPKAN